MYCWIIVIILCVVFFIHYINMKTCPEAFNDQQLKTAIKDSQSHADNALEFITNVYKTEVTTLNNNIENLDFSVDMLACNGSDPVQYTTDNAPECWRKCKDTDCKFAVYNTDNTCILSNGNPYDCTFKQDAKMYIKT